MFKTLLGRSIFLVFVTGLAGWTLYDNGLKLGLDLQGGMHIALEVDDPEGAMTPEEKADAIDQVDRVLRTRIDEFGVEEPLIQQVGTERLIVELAGIDDEGRAKSIVQRNAYLEFKLVRPVTGFSPALPRIDRAIVAELGVDSIRALGRAVSVLETTSSLEDLLTSDASEVAADSAADPIAADPRAADAGGDAADAVPEDEPEGDVLSPFQSLLNQGDVPGTYLVAERDVEAVDSYLALEDVRRALPRGLTLHWEDESVIFAAQNYRRLYVLEEDPFLTGEGLESAVAGRDPQTNQPEVQFELTRAAGRSFGQATGANVGQYLAVVLDGEVMSAPIIQSQITRSGRIEMGGGGMAEAADLALVLRAGALPAQINIVEERTVGPSLGQDSIDQGRIAGMVGIAVVILIMLAYYRVAGALAVLALGIYVVLVLGGLAGFEATLTLPGIAGLILSIGMAVDANVLIFERIREELLGGRPVHKAVSEGFRQALSAIVDANITTLITALILYQFGTGPVRGFAVTLSIGIIASFFSAIFVSRTFFTVYLRRRAASASLAI